MALSLTVPVGTKPSWDVVAENDHMIPPALQQAMAKRIGAHTIKLASSHLAMLSHPQAVADTILAAVRAVEEP